MRPLMNPLVSQIPDVDVAAPEVSGHASVPEVISDVGLPDSGGDVPLAGESDSPPNASCPDASMPGTDLVDMVPDMPSMGGDVPVATPSVDESVKVPDRKVEGGDASLVSGVDAAAVGLSGNKLGAKVR